MNVVAPLELAAKAAGVLAERGFENARLEAELLLAGVLCVKRLDLYLQHDRPVSPEELERFRSAVRRRLRHEPLQYIAGTAAFRRLELAVDARVLIPRPETELLVGAVLERMVSRASARAAGEWGAALDVGTGSGAIGLSLALEGSFSRVVATDLSEAALAVAAENARRTGLGDIVELRAGPVFEPLRAGERFRAIVSNPPYIAEADRDTLPLDVRAHEPTLALFSGTDGLDVIRALIEGAPSWLEPGGLLALEIGADQADAVLSLVRATASYDDERIVPDLAGRPRILLADRRD